VANVILIEFKHDGLEDSIVGDEVRRCRSLRTSHFEHRPQLEDFLSILELRVSKGNSSSRDRIRERIWEERYVKIDTSD
jgi:hypothetical protein